MGQVSGTVKSVCSFEIASIRPSKGDLPTREHVEGEGTIYRATSLYVAQLLYESFQVKDHQQVVGMPKWVEDELFDLSAKIPESQAPTHCLANSPGEATALADLLGQRFGLRYHIVQRPVEVYGLHTVARRFKLQPVTPDPQYIARFPRGDNRLMPPARLQVEYTDMANLAHILTYFFDHYIIDRTGLTGHYTLEVVFDHFTPHGREVAQPESNDESGPPLPTALEEQVGLKLIPERLTLPVYVIDNIERPSPN